MTEPAENTNTQAETSAAPPKGGRVLEPGDARNPETDRRCVSPDGVLEQDHEAEWQGQPTIRFFPDHFISEATTMVMLLCLYTVLSVFLPAALDARANPAVTPVGIKPAWYFLFLYEYLHFVPPLVGTITPLVLLVLLAAWPFLDRNPSRKPRKRVIALILAVVVVLTIIGLSVAGAVVE